MIHLLLSVIYLAFISLGLPDSLLGAAWPSMYGPLGVPLSCSGVIFFLISAGTVAFSLQSDRLIRKWGAGKVTLGSVAMTAAALYGFSVSRSFPALCLWAIPYGLGAGSVDAALNNYVALHFASRHMSWLHCMWGVGATLGPRIMSSALVSGGGWQLGYRRVALLQTALALVLWLSLPLWKRSVDSGKAAAGAALPLAQVLRIPGARAVMATFFCYCALEQTAGLWAGSYLALHRGMEPELSARFASLFFPGITLGRALSGFLTLRLGDGQMVRLGQGILALGIAALLLPLGTNAALAGLILIGLGCAPIYPCLIHATPTLFGAEKSQAIIGVQMASAYVGTCCMPPLFGVIAHRFSLSLLPFALLGILAVMVCTHERLLRRSGE